MSRPNSSLVGALPHSTEAEELLLSCCFIDGSEIVQRCVEAGITAGSFYEHKHGVLFAKALDLQAIGAPVDIATVAEELKKSGQLGQVGGYAFLAAVSSRVPTTANAPYFIDRVRDQAKRRAAIRLAAELVETCHTSTDDTTKLIERYSAQLQQTASVGGGAGILTELATRRAGFGREIKPQRPILSLAGVPIYTRGNIGLMTALQKVGKSAAVGGMLGALVAGDEPAGDTLGFSGENLAGHAVLHLDTEQAPEDHERVFNTALKRAGQPAPQWLHSYGVKGYGIEQLQRILVQLPRALAKAHGGIAAIILDGVGDFIADVNKPEECVPFVTQLEALATEHDCAVVCVLHLNPSPSNQATKSRGHLGSQLERKCETDLRLSKDADGITTMFTASARRAPIFEQDGPRFRWSEEASMHVLLGSTKGAARMNAEAEALHALADDVFGDRGFLRYGDLLTALKSTLKCSDSTAERRFKALQQHKVITRFPPNLWGKAA